MISYGDSFLPGWWWGKIKGVRGVFYVERDTKHIVCNSTFPATPGRIKCIREFFSTLTCDGERRVRLR